MDLTQFKELGVAGIAIAAIAYVCFRLIKELSESRINYSSFVQENNHTTTDLVREATATMVQVRESIETHNRALEKLIDKLN